jgi:hypothetical protein
MLGSSAVLPQATSQEATPNAEELRLKRWNKGMLTESQLLDLLTKPFGAKRRSFSGRT